MILANYAQQNRNCTREVGMAFTNPLGQFRAPLFNAFYLTAQAMPSTWQQCAFPVGYNTESAWWPARTAGGLGASDVGGTGTLSAAALAVKLALANLTGSGELTATGGLIVQAIAALSGSGGVTAANLQAFLAAVASLSGSGTLTATATGLGEVIAALTGTGTATGSTATALGELSADLTVTGTGLTTANVAQAVWAGLATANNVPGTMGELLNNSGAGGNPWATVIEGSYTAEQLLRLIAAALLGKATATPSTYTVRDLADTLNRIIADVDADGNRTAVTLDPS